MARDGKLTGRWIIQQHHPAEAGAEYPARIVVPEGTLDQARTLARAINEAKFPGCDVYFVVDDDA